MKPISYFDFQRKRFMRLLRNRIHVYLVKCKLFKTENLKLAESNYKRILEIVNDTVQRKEVFDRNNIFLVIQYLDDHGTFIDEFSENIKNTEDIDTLKDRQIAFFKKQEELEKVLKDNYASPQPIELPPE